MTQAHGFLFLIVFALASGLFALFRFMRKQESLSDKSLQISLQDNVATLTLSRSYSIAEFGFMWQLVNTDAKRASERQALFAADYLIIDFSLLESVSDMSCEFYFLNGEYIEKKGKPIIFCGVSPGLQGIFNNLECSDLSTPLIFPTLPEALKFVGRH